MSETLYRERAELIAALSKVFPASIEIDHALADWPVVIVELPNGQVSWHLAPSDLNLFDHLPRGVRVWDGHSTARKRARLAALPPQPPLPQLETV